MARTIHEIQSEVRYFTQILEGLKTGEIVLNNYEYKLHDIVKFQEYDVENGYTGREAQYVITYIITDWETRGLQENYVLICFLPLMEFIQWVTQ